MTTPKISIIIPTLNEEALLKRLLPYLRHNSKKNIAEVLVIDGGSTDCTVQVAQDLGATVYRAKRGRASQMNFGASKAKGNVLYFLHADTFPPKDFDLMILNAVARGFQAGCFRMRFDTHNPVLRFFAWFSRINHTLCRGGDQSLFINKNVFVENSGFNEAYLIYEDSEFIRRLYQNTNFKVLPKPVVTSARKYRQKGWLKVQFHFAMIHLKNYLGAGPEELYRYYSKNLL